MPPLPRLPLSAPSQATAVTGTHGWSPHSHSRPLSSMCKVLWGKSSPEPCPWRAPTVRAGPRRQILTAETSVIPLHPVTSSISCRGRCNSFEEIRWGRISGEEWRAKLISGRWSSAWTWRHPCSHVTPARFSLDAGTVCGLVAHLDKSRPSSRLARLPLGA